MKILVLDNYDSFTFNLVQYIQEILEHKIDVFRNDAISLEAVDHYDVIILSPGPGLPSNSGIMPKLIKKYAGEKMILGVCLGHQAIGEAFGSELENLSKVYHGVDTPIHITDQNDLLFEGIEQQIQVGRYHSWVINKKHLSPDLKVTALDSNGEIMAIKHKEHQIWGVQFHPESIMTKDGMKMLRNFLNHCKNTLEAAVPAVA
ncbi:MAG: aminodeoxychorismate/anthranilate synthase component II [Bacteroidota bacterium]